VALSLSPVKPGCAQHCVGNAAGLDGAHLAAFPSFVGLTQWHESTVQDAGTGPGAATHAPVTAGATAILVQIKLHDPAACMVRGAGCWALAG